MRGSLDTVKKCVERMEGLDRQVCGRNRRSILTSTGSLPVGKKVAKIYISCSGWKLLGMVVGRQRWKSFHLLWWWWGFM